MYIEQKYLLLVSSQLQQFKKKGDYLYNFRCPYCGDSHKNKTKARGYFFRKDANFIYKCHNCGKGSSFQNLLKHVDPKIYDDYIFERYKKNDADVPDIGKFQQPNFMKGPSPLKSLKKISSLRHDHPVKKFVENRRIPNTAHFELFFAPKFYEWVNKVVPNKFPSLKGDHPRLVIPFFDENNKMFAFQGRAFGNEQPKYITIKFDDTKEKIYGLDRLDLNKPVMITEGPIDSLFLDNAIALAGADANIKIQPQQCTMIFDNEPRNKEIVKRMITAVDKKFNVAVWPKSLKYKDINDIIIAGKTAAEVQTLISNNTHCGLTALQQINNWKRI